ncbi:Fanconi anemia core complex-associated protein 20 isoform X3 [Phocoena sinus]|uniref:Fanconi anemia core complex-associated protein 20 isoform X3 n=1 Tax=Phocoena sinus TaxID=42100 RepID=UPI0013C4F162|nr:Fanconi anemia core complex-associated protein 20 isoform X3 [Phocoena sinus]
MTPSGQGSLPTSVPPPRWTEEPWPPSPQRLRSPSNPPGSPPDGGECARPWAELLRAACAELNVDGEPPPLPAFPGQEPRRSPERAPPESFTVGTETFSWTPFPPAPRRGGDPSDSDRVLREAPGRTESSAWSPQRHPAPEPRGTSSAEKQPSVEGLPTLQSCPMCQAVFAPRLTQLDIESHLARCLAESTDDVVCPSGSLTRGILSSDLARGHSGGHTGQQLGTEAS